MRSLGLCWCLLLGACAGTPAVQPQTYVVRPEDTLYSVAWRHDLDFRDLARWNHIGADFRISVGEVLLLGPSAKLRAPPPAVHAATETLEHARETYPHRWVWPTDRLAPARAAPGGGILLSGRLGQDVRAASGGRVVYTGSALRGYGNLIIIKHADSLLSAYGHNREMLVRDGQEVAAGQIIARMGEEGPQQPALYFEIRRDGKPVDPLPYMPK